MQRVLSQRDEVARRAAAQAEHLRDKFSLESVGTAARQRLQHLLRRTNPTKWQRLHTAERQGRLKPAVPIPGEWYDADYFEHGVKSNWREGYHWSSFSGLFRETAMFLADTFPEAQSFLDAGCAKGFLVRALREQGKECWGFDHSRWALNHAEELARPHLWQASAETVEFKHSFDVFLAFSLFDGLTEEQSRTLLERARRFTRQAIFAVIATCDNEAQERELVLQDHDLAHITLRQRGWWHELFLATGWKQDALHRMAARVCQNHSLPKQMAWQTFVYSAT
jgi:2-polyprenyl-3-methyl-5-hydroxy-6-metoxy-1,4-benzoquinol methylase